MAEVMDDAIIVAYGANMISPGLTTSQAYDAVVKSLEAKDIAVISKSKLWQSAAWPDPQEPPYFNAVMIVNTQMQPADLLAALHEIEAAAGRRRDGARYAPRTLDLDLIAYGRRLSEDVPVLPHPRAHERGFVMGPLAEIAPGWRHPLSGQSAAALFAQVTAGRDARPSAPL